MGAEVGYETDGEIGWIRLRRAGAAAVSRADREEFNRVLREANDDPRTSILCLHIHGYESRDLETPAGGAGSIRNEPFVPGDLLVSPKPVIAGIEGLLRGWWLELALQCDLRMVTTSAGVQFDLDRGEAGADARLVTWYLPRLIGVSQACWLLFSGEYISAREGHELGLFCSVVPETELVEETRKMAELCMQGAGASLAQLRSLIYGGLGRSLAEQLTSRV